MSESIEPISELPPDTEFKTDELMPIVVGAHLRAEIATRPLARLVWRAIFEWQAANLEGNQALLPVICTDLWFLNDRDLMRQPCIAIGDPGINAASAYYASRLPKAYVVESICAIQCDPQFVDGSVCIWGVDTESTKSAVMTFVGRYLDAYLRAVHGV